MGWVRTAVTAGAVVAGAVTLAHTEVEGQNTTLSSINCTDGGTYTSDGRPGKITLLGGGSGTIPIGEVGMTRLRVFNWYPFSDQPQIEGNASRGINPGPETNAGGTIITDFTKDTYDKRGRRNVIEWGHLEVRRGTGDGYAGTTVTCTLPGFRR